MKSYSGVRVAINAVIFGDNFFNISDTYLMYKLVYYYYYFPLNSFYKSFM
jgi:hypothetical protein